MRYLPMVVLAAMAGAILAQTQPAKSEPGASPAESRFVVLANIDNQVVNPATARYLNRVINDAEERKAEALILILDTPGGLLESTREMTRAILNSRVPVVVYVAPSGGRAASAGVFITIAAHAAAMAPGTNIGAAHPVSVGGVPGVPDESPDPAGKDGKNNGKEGPAGKRPSPMEEKALNDTVAWAQSIADLRGRNSEWVTRAVKESISATSTEAVKLNVVDFVARDVDDLLKQLDGREVSIRSEKRILNTAGARIDRVDMWWGERTLSALAHPNIAFLLLIFGFYGIILEFYSPGWGVAGTIGVVCLVLGFFALAVLPVNYVGLSLILVGLAMFVAEAFVASHGFLTLGGAICLLFGGLMLVDSPVGFMRVSIWTVAPVVLATVAISMFLVVRIVEAHRTRPATGGEGLLFEPAVADEDFIADGADWRGRVRAHGELWRAVSKAPVQAGAKLRIENRTGLTLQVGPSGGLDSERKES
jgi:membrane-bound serine protease (ClpP class)